MLAYIDTTSRYHTKRGNTVSKELKGCCQDWIRLRGDGASSDSRKRQMSSFLILFHQ
jgi:hypothetical protein